VFTVGHAALPLEDFLTMLREGGVEAVADVRRHPGSRRSPQFGADSLAASLAEAGVSYHPFRESLGGRRSRKDAPEASVDNSGWEHPSFRAYADYMHTPAFGDGLAGLEELAAAETTAVMCAETHPSRCHRRLIADALLVRGWRVLHLLPGRDPQPHELTAHARFEAGVLSYPGRPADRLRR
jgi:uncharacterized protein (DUF488 family)